MAACVVGPTVTIAADVEDTVVDGAADVDVGGRPVVGVEATAVVLCEAGEESVGSSPKRSDGELSVALIGTTTDSAPGSSEDGARPPAAGETELFPRLPPFSFAGLPLWAADRGATESLATDSVDLVAVSEAEADGGAGRSDTGAGAVEEEWALVEVGEEAVSLLPGARKVVRKVADAGLGVAADSVEPTGCCEAAVSSETMCGTGGWTGSSPGNGFTSGPVIALEDGFAVVSAEAGAGIPRSLATDAVKLELKRKAPDAAVGVADGTTNTDPPSSATGNAGGSAADPATAACAIVAGAAAGKLVGQDDATEAADKFVFDELAFDEAVFDGAAFSSSDICGTEGRLRVIPFCEFSAAPGVDNRPLAEDSGKAVSTAAEVGRGAGIGKSWD